VNWIYILLRRESRKLRPLRLVPFVIQTHDFSEIETCLSLLQTTSDRFSTARHCHAVLSILLKDLHAQFDDTEGRRPQSMSEPLQKRRRFDTPPTFSTQPKSPSAMQTQSSEFDSQQPSSATSNHTQLMMAPSIHAHSSQPIFEFQQSSQTTVPWADPMMSGDVGDVFGQVSWEALFQVDGSDWGIGMV
jgi:hypothetical protein